MQLTKLQVETLLKNAPAGVDKKLLLDKYILNGYDLEGVDNNAVRQKLQKQQQSQQPSEEKGSFAQLGENISNLPNQAINRGQEALTAIQNQPKLAEQAGNSPLAKLASIGATAGHLAGTVARGVGDIFGAVISPFIPKEAQQVIGNVASEINTKVDSIPGMTPEIKQHLGDVFDTVSLLGGQKAEPIIKDTVKQGAIKTGEMGQKVASNVVETGQKVALKAKEGIAPTPTPVQALGQISQGATKNLNPLKETIKNIDTTGVKTYSDFATKIKQVIPELSKNVDNEFLKDTTKKIMSGFDEVVGSGDNAVKVNYVQQGINDLKDYFTKTNNPTGLSKIKAIENTANKSGLTYKEVNDIAKLHGEAINAFNASGQAASGLTKQAAENTRKGLKNIARQALTGPEAKALDSQLSNILNTKKLIEKQVEAVNKLNQKVEKRGWVSEATYRATKALNAISGGGLRGITDALLNRGTGLKTLNALDIEKNLARNLEIVKKALEANTEIEFQNIIKNIK